MPGWEKGRQYCVCHGRPGTHSSVFPCELGSAGPGCCRYLCSPFRIPHNVRLARLHLSPSPEHLPWSQSCRGSEERCPRTVQNKQIVRPGMWSRAAEAEKWLQCSLIPFVRSPCHCFLRLRGQADKKLLSFFLFSSSGRFQEGAAHQKIPPPPQAHTVSDPEFECF